MEDYEPQTNLAKAALKMLTTGDTVAYNTLIAEATEMEKLRPAVIPNEHDFDTAKSNPITTFGGKAYPSGTLLSNDGKRLRTVDGKVQFTAQEYQYEFMNEFLAYVKQVDKWEKAADKLDKKYAGYGS
ncbi:MAG: hypothetical protein Q9195_001020 [Heterodermia aff. obscurata]